jgi:hypothetical protein
VNLYKQFVDEWNQDVPGYSGGGDDTIEQDATEEVINILTDQETTATVTDAAGEFDFDVPTSGTVIFPPLPNTQRGVPHDGGRPTRVRKLVQKLVPIFKGKLYGTTMSQYSK